MTPCYPEETAGEGGKREHEGGDSMDFVQKIKGLLREAELYRSQGLLNEAGRKYENAIDLIEKNDRIKGREKILAGIVKKLDILKTEVKKIEEANQMPELSAEIQDLIKKKFSFAAEKEQSTLEGAIALAKFGQYRAALKEFNDLIKTEADRIVAAKNIIRCHVSLQAYEEAVNQYREWSESGFFTRDQLDNLLIFINSIFEKKGIGKAIPAALDSAEITVPELEIPEISTESEPLSIEIPGLKIPDPEESGLTAEDLDDVSSIGITLCEGTQSGKLIEFEISFHLGTEITIIMPERQKELATLLQPGYKLENVQFYTPFAMLNGKCMVESNIRIGTGPKRGDYSLDLRVLTG